MNWICEDIFGPWYKGFLQAVAETRNVNLILWDDALWEKGLPRPPDPVLFHGSLNNASKIAALAKTDPQEFWSPGAFCDVAAFECSAWYPRARKWLVQQDWLILPWRLLLEVPETGAVVFDENACTVFIRPNSPLKQFSGRIVDLQTLKPEDVDFGYYFEDENLPVVLTRPQGFLQNRSIADWGEWRFVVVNQKVVAGSEALPAHSSIYPRTLEEAEPCWQYAAEVAAEFEPPEDVYILDVCRTPEGFAMLEINPFSGADLYACEPTPIIKAVADLLEKTCA